MNPRRRSTVHDLAALRLHRDGGRVLNSDSNLSSRRAKYSTRDARGNWIAQDAGGLGTVTQRPGASKPDEGEEAASEPEGDEELSMEDLPVSPRRDKGKGRARESGDEEVGIALDTRARKRSRFDEDLSFLDSGTPLAPAPSLEGEPFQSQDSPFPVPPSDLLKCLHYFASTYYTSMGQLYDATRDYRKERKVRKAQKLKKTQVAGSNHAASEDEGLQDGSSQEVSESSDDDEGGGDRRLESSAKGKEAKKDTRKKKRSRQLRPMDKDMYKTFDGSALVALGMLLQEHIAELLEPKVPEGWEKEMALAKRNQIKDARRARRTMIKRQSVKVALPGAAGEQIPESEEEDGGDTQALKGEEEDTEEEEERHPRRSVAGKQKAAAADYSSSDDDS